MKRILLTSLLTGLLGCATTQDFKPADNTSAYSSSGTPAVVYNIATDGGRIGRVRIWSKGAYKAELQGNKVTMIKISMEVENASAHPVTLDVERSWIDSLSYGDRELALRPFRYEGSPVIPPQTAQTVSLYFVIPSRPSPSDVDGFRLRWEMLDALGHRYLQWTPFVQNNPPDFYYYRPYYYDPFVYGPWGPWSI
jgi:hypothetical protein